MSDPRMSATRPYIQIQDRVWKTPDGDHIPGIALTHGASVKAHLTYAEARTFADRLHDLVDAAGNAEPPLPQSHPESE